MERKAKSAQDAGLQFSWLFTRTDFIAESVIIQSLLLRNKMKIRKAQKKDVDGCYKLSRQEHEHYWEKKDFYSSLKNKDIAFYVAEEDGKIIGFSEAFITPTRRKEALMHETRIDVKYRRKDIGTKLVNAVVNDLYKKNVKIISALIKPELRKFYVNSCKFKEVDKWLEVVKKK